MKLPAIVNIISPAFVVDEVGKAPWHELILFETHARFRNPRCSSPEDKGYSSKQSPIFINSLSKACYSNFSDDLDPPPTYGGSINIYRTGWEFGQNRLLGFALGKPSIKLVLVISAIYVAKHLRERYTNIMKPEIAKAWLEHRFTERHNLFGQIQFEQTENPEIYEVKFGDDSTSQQSLARTSPHNIAPFIVNGNAVYKCSLTGSAWQEFYIPFSEEDFLNFEFRIELLRDMPKEESDKLLKQASDWAMAIVSSFEMIFPDKVLSTDQADS